MDMSNSFKNSPTFRLFRNEPSFIEGLSRLLDLGSRPERYNESETPEGADYDALESDWQAVGNDMKASIKAYEQRLAKSA